MRLNLRTHFTPFFNSRTSSLESHFSEMRMYRADKLKKHMSDMPSIEHKKANTSFQLYGDETHARTGVDDAFQIAPKKLRF